MALTYESVRGTAPAAIASEQRKYGDHRRALEMMRSNADIAVTMAGIDERKRDSAEARVGQVCALIICLASIAAGAITAIYGHDWAGSAIGVGGIGGIVTTFIVGRRGSRKPGHRIVRPMPISGRKTPSALFSLGTEGNNGGASFRVGARRNCSAGTSPRRGCHAWSSH